MPSIPLQFVNALLLVIFLVRLARREEGPPNRFILAMIAVYALLSIVHGLRWGYGIEMVRPLRPVISAIIPPLCWIGFSTFTAAHATARGWRRLWFHALPLVAVVVLMVAAPGLIDPALFLIDLGYGIALLALARTGPDAFDRVRLDGSISVFRALQVTALGLIFSGFVDLAIDIDFMRSNGIHAAWIAGLAGIVFIVVLGWAAVVAGGNAPAAEAETAPPRTAAQPASPEPEDGQVIAGLNALMGSMHLYRDPELSLDRLARRMLVPARRISAAVNRVRGMNVSQYVNEYRIGEACRRLSETDQPITQIMFEAGFQTKSNFNREFLRVTGKSPSAWRAERKPAPTNLA